MGVARGRAGRLAMVGALCGMVAAIAAPHLGDLSAGPPDTDPVETTEPAAPDTTMVEVTVESAPTSPPTETSPPTTVDDSDTTEAAVETTEPEPTGPLPTIAPSPKPEPAADTTEPEGTVGPAAEGDYGVDVVAVCVDGTTPVVDFTSTSIADIIVTVGGEPNWSAMLAPGAHAQGTWPADDRGNPSTTAKWDAASVDPDDPWFIFGDVVLPADCPPPPNTPSAPENFTTTAGDGSVALSWSPPSWDGGSEITDYVIEYNAYPVDDAWTPFDDGGATSNAIVGGLTNGIVYLFRVRADNANGAGEWIEGKDTPRLITTPSAPLLMRAVATGIAGQVFLSWNQPSSNGGRALTVFRIQRSLTGTSGWSVVADIPAENTTYIVNGLTSGTRYYFRVYALNEIGVGAPSSIRSAIPGSPPSAPRSLTATPTNRSGEIRLTWLAPTSSGAPPLHDYIIQRSPTGTSQWTTVADGVNIDTTYTVTGLTNGARYYFRVYARNVVFTSVRSNMVSSVPRTVPAVPRSFTAAPTNRSGEIRLTWLAPTSSGGSPITDYVIQRSPTGTSQWTLIADGVNVNTRYTVTGLTNGRRYYFRVYARNAAGLSAPTPIVSAIPRNVLTAPRSLLASSGSSRVYLSWTVPYSNGGSAITDYIIQRSPNGLTGWVTINDGVSTRTTHTATGLTNGVRYYFRVFARTALATSAPSNIANAVPRTVPSAPQNLTGVGTATYDHLDWDPPASNGGSAIIDYVGDVWNGVAWERMEGSVTGTEGYIPVEGTGCSHYRVAARNAVGVGAWAYVYYVCYP